MRIHISIALVIALAAALPAAYAQESPPPASEEAAVDQSAEDQAAEGEPTVEESAVEAPSEGAEDEVALEEPPVADNAAEGMEAAQAEVGEFSAEVERLGAALEEANAIIDELRSEAWELKEKARAAEELAKAERAAAAAAETAANAAVAAANEQAGAEAAAAERDAAVKRIAAAEESAAARAAEAAELRDKAAALESRIAELEAKREGTAALLSTWGSSRIDPAAFSEILLRGFGGATARMGKWKIEGDVAAQTDGAQYFSRLTFPMVQSPKPTLYSFDVETGAKGWVGAGLHFFAEGVRKPKGYGEGKSLLVWLTRDAKARGDNETYLQIYRSDDDVNMERVLDAEIREGLAAWNRVDILYEPGPEFVVIAVNGTVRAAYRTFFGIGTGVSVSLRTLGEGVAFRNFEVRR